MKKILTIVLLLAVALGASAKFRLGPTVGMNFSDYHWTQSLINTDINAGFQGGLLCEVMIPGIGFGVDFGVKYANRGGRCAFGDKYIWSSDGIDDTNLRLHEIQIPVNLRFKYTRLNGIENYVAPMAFAGPTFNFNIANSKCPAIERAAGSVGLQVGLGAELFKRYQITCGYIWDVTYDVETRKLDNYSARIQGWMVDVAVLF